ncbi:hypothetical protein V501_05488 [Pseudogymnoascus sp. VKM F-4519 (FW-2642)]|nr:hypothetical protein V501_05488 [Pseudogymnoascus sp. VKM F-4519 (FW-2642)]
MLQRTYLTHQLFTVTPSTEQQHNTLRSQPLQKIRFNYLQLPEYSTLPLRIPTLEFSHSAESSDKHSPPR